MPSVENKTSPSSKLHQIHLCPEERELPIHCLKYRGTEAPFCVMISRGQGLELLYLLWTQVICVTINSHKIYPFRPYLTNFPPSLNEAGDPQLATSSENLICRATVSIKEIRFRVSQLPGDFNLYTNPQCPLRCSPIFISHTVISFVQDSGHFRRYAEQ